MYADRVVGRSAVVAFSLAIIASAGCKQGTGEACTADGDCDPGLVCDINATSGPVCAGSLSGLPDAAPPPPDAMVWVNTGFELPEEITAAYREVNDAVVYQGDADWSCLGSVAPLPTADAITVPGIVRDFATGFSRSGVTISAYDENDLDSAAIAEDTSASDGTFSLDLPDGFTRVGMVLSSGGPIDTVVVNALFYDPVVPDFALPQFSENTASVVASLDGGSRQDGTAQIAGQVFDCSWNRVANAAVTVSSLAGGARHVPEVITFYGNDDEPSVALPHSQRTATGQRGTFHAVDIETDDDVFVQVWGYQTGQTPGADAMMLVDEFRVTPRPDAVMLVLMGPLRTYN